MDEKETYFIGSQHAVPIKRKWAATDFAWDFSQSVDNKPPQGLTGGFKAPVFAPEVEKRATPAGGFSFGAPAKKADDKKPAAAANPFSSPNPFAAMADKAAPVVEDKPLTKPFTFGAAPAAPPASGGFTFGAPSKPAAEKADAPAKPAGVFSFGAPAEAKSEEKPAKAVGGFTVKPAAANPFMMGAKQTETHEDKPAETAAPVKASPFAFGAKASVDDKTKDDAAKKPNPFSFGASAKPVEKKEDKADAKPAPFSFNAAKPTPKEEPAVTKPNPFALPVKTEEKKEEKKEEEAPSSTQGSTLPKFRDYTTQDATDDKPAPATFTFGAAPTKDKKVTFSFGKAAEPAAKPQFSFTPAPAATPAKPPPAKAFTFEPSAAVPKFTISSGSMGDQFKDAVASGATTRTTRPTIDGTAVETGEDGESDVHSVRVKMFEMTPASEGKVAEWRHRGVGELKIKKDAASGKHRMLLRNEKSKRTILNASCFVGMPVRHEGKAVHLSLVNSAPVYEDVSANLDKSEAEKKADEKRRTEMVTVMIKCREDAAAQKLVEMVKESCASVDAEGA